MSQPLLIVGADGLLGGALLHRARAAGVPCQATRLAPTAADPALHSLDLAAPLDAWEPPAPTHAALLCAAVTRLDACRADPARTRHINVVQTLELARRLTARGVFVVFPSSNLVFDGDLSRTPADHPVHPRTEYGRQKAEVEAGLRDLGPHIAIVRLTKVVHPDWPLLRAWRDALAAGQPVHPFPDLVCAPIPLDRVVDGLLAIARDRRAGLWQFSAARDVSYADLARHVADRLNAPAALVQPRPAGDLGGVEHRPAHTTLDTSRARRELDLEFPDPLAALDPFLAPGSPA